AIVHDSVAGDPLWLVEHQDDGSNVRLVRMNNVLSATPTFTDFVVNVDDYLQAVASPQPGGANIDSGDRRMLSVVQRGSRLVATHGVGLDMDNVAGADQTSVRWYEFEVHNAGTPTVKQQGDVDPAFGTHTYY